MKTPQKNLLPEKFTEPKTSPLKLTIKEGTNDVSLDVRDEVTYPRYDAPSCDFFEMVVLVDVHPVER